MRSRSAGLAVLAWAVIVAGCSGSNATPPAAASPPVGAPTPSRTAGVTSAPSRAPAPTQALMVKPSIVFRLSARGGTAFYDGSVWLAGGDTLLRIDPASGVPVATIQVDGIAKFVFVGAGSIWVSRARAAENGPAMDATTVRVDPATNRVTGHTPFGAAFGFGSLWAIDGNGLLLRVDPTTGRTVGSVQIQGPVNWAPQIAIGFDSVWVASGDDHTVARVDPRTMKLTASIGQLGRSDSLLAIGVGFDSVWADANAGAPTGVRQGSGMLYRIDPGSNEVIASIPLGSQTTSSGYGATVVGIGEGSVWTGDSDSTISRVDPGTNAVVAVRSDLSSHEFIAAGFGSVWADDERFDAGDWTP